MTSALETLQEMKTVAAELRKELEHVTEISVRRVQADRDFQQKWDTEYLRAEGTEQSRKSMANLKTLDEKQMLDGLIAEERISKSRIKSYQGLLSAYQTASTAYREEARFARTGS